MRTALIIACTLTVTLVAIVAVLLLTQTRPHASGLTPHWAHRPLSVVHYSPSRS